MRAIVSVINDLSTDQRVHKVCTTLHQMGYEVLLVGRKQRKSFALASRDYKTQRMFLLFEKGVMFYIEFQIRLFFKLLFNNSTVLVANDLDTLLPNFLVSKIKRNHLVYDTHELFCEVPELQSNSSKRKIWKGLEKFIFPKLKYVFTVNDSIANIYSNEYQVPVIAIRNVPILIENEINVEKTKEELNLPTTKKIIILQGAGINVDRGAEEAVEAMQYIENALLLIVGSGDVIPELKRLTVAFNLENKIQFTGKVPFELLRKYTACADLGLSLDKDTNVNYKYSLPNKLFDYIHCGVPVLASNLIEIKQIIEKYKVGDCIEDHQPKHIAEKINYILADDKLILEWKLNTTIAAKELNWQIESKKLIQVYSNFLKK
jgi:glycosyltransferase involved in cell wall biosynthesis